MRRNKLFIAATAGIMATSVVTGTGIEIQAATTTFSDVLEKNSHYPAIMDLAQRGVIQGYSDGTFRPNEVVTYKQAAKIIAGSIGLNGDDQEIAAIFQRIGFSENVTSINQPVTRYAMAEILMGILKLPVPTEVELPFTDVATQYQQAVEFILAYGITVGTSTTTFSGEKFVTRGQFATFVTRAEPFMERATETQGARLTVKDIQNNKLVTEGQQWTIGGTAQAILNAKNIEALVGANLDVIVQNGEIIEVLSIDINVDSTALRPKRPPLANSDVFYVSPIVLDGGNASVGNIVVNSDFVELKNMTVTGDVRVTGRVANLALNQLEVKGELLLQGIEMPKTASLNKVAAMPELTTVFMQDSTVGHIIIMNGANLNSNTRQPLISHLGGSLQLNGVGPTILFLQLQAAGLTVGGAAEIQTLEIHAGYNEVILKYIQRLEEEIKKAEKRVNDLKQAIAEQSSKLDSARKQKVSKEVVNLYAGLHVLQIEYTEGQRRLAELKKALQELLQKEKGETGTLPHIGIEGTLKIQDFKLPTTIRATITLGEKAYIANLWPSLSPNKLKEIIKNSRPGQIGNILSGNNQIQLPVVDSGNTGGSTSGGSAGGGNANPTIFDTASLELWIGKAKTYRVNMKSESISEYGNHIPFDEKWMPQAVVDALDEAIVDAETMLASAKRNYQVASLTDVKLLLALTQLEINNMAKKLQELMALEPINGLKEKKLIYELLDGEELMIAGGMPRHTVTDDVIYEQMLQNLMEGLTHGQRETIQPIVSELGKTITWEEDALAFLLDEGISYTDPITQQQVELVPALKAQMTVTIPEIDIDVEEAHLVPGPIDIEFPESDYLIVLAQTDNLAALEELVSFEVGLTMNFGTETKTIVGTVCGVDSDGTIAIRLHDKNLGPTELVEITMEGYKFNLEQSPLPIRLPLREIVSVPVEYAYFVTTPDSAVINPDFPDSDYLVVYTSTDNVAALEELIGVGLGLTMNFGAEMETITGTVAGIEFDHLILIRLDSENPVPTELIQIVMEGYLFDLAPSPLPISPEPPEAMSEN